MRYGVLLLAAAFLSACSGNTPATATVEPQIPTLFMTAEVGTEEPTLTPFATIEGELPVPLPGTLVASETEDANAGIPFKTLYLTRTGGPTVEGEDNTINIEIRNSGVMMRNNVEGQISQEGLDRLNTLIRDMNFFGAQNAYLPAIPASGTGEDFLYSITVERAGEERKIDAVEGYMPDELQTLIAEVIRQSDSLR